MNRDLQSPLDMLQSAEIVTSYLKNKVRNTLPMSKWSCWLELSSSLRTEEAM